LVDRSLRLHERIVTLDAMVRNAQAGVREARSGAEQAENPVAGQLDLLAQSFARSRA
jgi:hypothetical protein